MVVEEVSLEDIDRTRAEVEVDVAEVEVGSERICFVRVRISDSVIRLT